MNRTSEAKLLQTVQSMFFKQGDVEMSEVKQMTWEETRQALIKLGVPEKRLPKEWQPKIDLTGLDLSGAQLSGAFLKGVRLAGTNLSHADLSYSDLSDANFVN